MNKWSWFRRFVEILIWLERGRVLDICLGSFFSDLEDLWGVGRREFLGIIFYDKCLFFKYVI